MIPRVAVLLASALLLLGAATSSGAPGPANQARLEKTVRYLQEAQNPDGGFGGSRGKASGSLFTAWVALALAAAGINPRDQAPPGGTDAYTYLVTHYGQGIAESDCAPATCTTTLERELMVANAAGESPRDFGGVDLVAELLARVRPDGSFPHVGGGQAGVNDTIFAIFALAPVDEPGARASVPPAADWVEAAQQEGGGWAWRAGPAPPEVDMTGAAIQALVAAGRGGEERLREGLDFLHEAQNPDGGFPMLPDTESNAASTCWAVQAIWAAGENPETWLTGSGAATEEPLDYLESLQAADGHLMWKTDDDLNGVWMTAYCAPAFAGQGWPIPAAPRAVEPPEPPQAGAGGGEQFGDGVMAGGGGLGAPAFSRPKPQSRGKTPGGARTLDAQDGPPKDHSRTRRGENARQSDRTQRSEAKAAAAGPLDLGGEGSIVDHAPQAGEGGGDGSGGGRSAALAGTGNGTDGAESGEAVTGALIGDTGKLRFGAPGLDGAGIEGGDGGTVAAGIGAAALLLGLGGLAWERRRQGALL